MARDISLNYIDGSTITDADAVLQQYEIALFTVPGEFSAEPEFGIGIQQWVGEVNNRSVAKSIRQYIIAKTRQLFPEIGIVSIAVYKSPETGNTISIQMDVIVIPYNQRRTIKKDITND